MTCLRALAQGAPRCPQAPRIVRRYVSNKANPSVPEVAVGSEVGRKLEIALGKASVAKHERLAWVKEQAAAASATGYAAADGEGHDGMPPSLAQRIGETKGWTSVAKAFPADVVEQIHRPDPDSFKQPEDPHVARVVIIGLENSGKSRLMNSMIGEHVSPISYRGYSSRRWSQGIRTFANKQLLLLDTPPLYAPLPLWKEHAVHVGAKFVSECRRRILCTESVWEALHSADGVVVALDGRYGMVNSEVLEILESLHRRLDALDRRVRVFFAITRLDEAEKPFRHAGKDMEDELAKVSPIVPEGFFYIDGTNADTYALLRSKLFSHPSLFLPAKHPYKGGTMHNKTNAEWVADLALEKCLRLVPTRKDIVKRVCRTTTTTTPLSAPTELQGGGGRVDQESG